MPISSDKKILRTIIIGMGKMGKIRLNALLKHGGFKIVGVCDNDMGTLQSFDYPKYSDWRKGIIDANPDVVVVCTINLVIPEIVCFAIEHGCHVFSEKPPGRNLADALRMKDVHDKHPNLVLKFGFNHRYHNSIMEAKALIDSGIIGKPVFVRGVYGKAGNINFATEWRNNPSLSGGGILLDQGIHMLDLIRYFLGDIAEVYSSIDNLVWKEIPTEDSAYIVFKTNNGEIASLHSTSIQWKHKFDMDIICDKGYIALNGILTSTQSYGEEKITYYKKDLKLSSGKLGNPIEYTMCFDTDDSWDLEMNEFYDSIAFGKPVKNGTDDDAVKVMALIEEIYRHNNRRA